VSRTDIPDPTRGEPDQRVRQLPAFVGIVDSGSSDISEHVDDLLARGFDEQSHLP
jgi:hypothetical protein